MSDHRLTTLREHAADSSGLLRILDAVETHLPDLVDELSECYAQQRLTSKIFDDYYIGALALTVSRSFGRLSRCQDLFNWLGFEIERVSTDAVFSWGKPTSIVSEKIALRRHNALHRIRIAWGRQYTYFNNIDLQAFIASEKPQIHCKVCGFTDMDVIKKGSFLRENYWRWDGKMRCEPCLVIAEAERQAVEQKRREQKQKERRPVLYLIRADFTKFYKIGYSTNVSKRLCSLQTSSPHVLTLLAVRNGTEGKEKKLHAQFAARRHGGEWFVFDREAEIITAFLNGQPNLLEAGQ